MAILNPFADNYIEKENPSQDNGAGTNLRLGTAGLNGKNPTTDRVLLGFYLAALVGQTVSAAQIDLTWTGSLGTAAAAHANRVTQAAWLEASTWNEYDDVGNLTWTTPGGDFTATGAVAFTMQVGNTSITGLASLAQDAIDNRAGLLLLLLKLDNEATVGADHQSNFTPRRGVAGPNLTITYSGPTRSFVPSRRRQLALLGR